MPPKLPEKLSFTLFLAVLSISTPPMITLPAFAVLLLLRQIVPDLRPISSAVNKRFVRMVGYFSLVAVLMTVLNGILIPGGSILAQVAGVTLFQEGVLFGVRTGARLLLLSSALMVFFGSTPMSDIAAFLHRVGLPTQIVMALLLTLHFLDSLPTRVSKIFEAQQARGAPVRSSILSRALAFFSILSPLVLSSLVESIDRGMALELRGYHSGTRLYFPGDGIYGFSFLTVFFLILTLLAIMLPWLPI